MPDRLSPSREQEIRAALARHDVSLDDELVEVLAELDAERATLAAIRAALSNTLTNDTAKVRDIWAVLLGCHWSEVKARLASAPAEKEKT